MLGTDFDMAARALDSAGELSINECYDNALAECCCDAL
jgi:hypothetical protein